MSEIIREIQLRVKQAEIDLKNSNNKIKEFQGVLKDQEKQKKILDKEITERETKLHDMKRNIIDLEDKQKRVKEETERNILNLAAMAKVAPEKVNDILYSKVERPTKEQKKEETKKEPGIFSKLDAKAAIRTAKAMSKMKSDKPKVINFSVKQFSKNYKKPDKYKTIEDLTFPYHFNFVAFAEGEWTDSSGCKTYYPWDVVKSAAELFKAPTVIDHVDISALDKFGRVEESKINEANQTIEISGVIFDTSMGKDTALLIENNLIDSVSARIVDQTEYVGGRFVATKITDVGHIAFVQKGGVDVAKIIG